MRENTRYFYVVVAVTVPIQREMFTATRDFPGFSSELTVSEIGVVQRSQCVVRIYVRLFSRNCKRYVKIWLLGFTNTSVLQIVATTSTIFLLVIRIMKIRVFFIFLAT